MPHAINNMVRTVKFPFTVVHTTLAMDTKLEWFVNCSQYARAMLTTYRLTIAAFTQACPNYQTEHTYDLKFLVSQSLVIKSFELKKGKEIRCQ